MVDLLLSPEQQAVEDAILGVMAAEFPLSRLRTSAGYAGDMERWDLFARMGWTAIDLAEDRGGSGFSIIEDILLWRAAGRYLVTPSLIAASVAVHAAQARGDEDLKTALINGSKTAAFAIERRSARAGEDGSELYLIDARDAAVLLVIGSEGIRLSAVSDLLSRTPAAALDEAVELEQAIGRRVSGLPDPALGALDQRLELYLSAYMVGIAEAARDMAVEYAKTRVQFGRPIGAFQAVKHHCANMACRAEIAWAQTAMATLTLSVQDGPGSLQVAASRRVAEEAALWNAAMNVQVHGGIGFTEEASPHHLIKRARLVAQLFPGAPQAVGARLLAI